VRRLALVAAALVVPALPVLAAAPAYAATHVICVGVPGGTCDESFLALKPALLAANANGLDDLVRVAPGVYSDGPYFVGEDGHALTLQGAGQSTDPFASTTITLPTSASINTYVNVDGATVQNLRVVMAGGANSNDTALNLSDGAAADHVTIVGAGTVNSVGVHVTASTLTASSVLMPRPAASDTRAVYVEGGSTVSDSILTGTRGLVQSAPGLSDVLSRVTIEADSFGIITDGGTVTVDDTVLDMGGAANSAGIAALNGNDSTTPMTINANHVTIVGSGSGSRGVWANATSPGGKQTSAITVSNSIIRGPATSLVAEATNTVGPTSTATLNVSYTDYQTVSPSGAIGTNGAGGVALGAGNVVNVDPGFVNAAAGNYHLSAGSPVADKGNPGTSGPATDRDGAARVLDGDAVVGAIRDLGAYELPAVVRPPTADTTAPETTITKKPGKRTTKKKVKLTFSSEAGATFECQVDGKAWKVCTSPLKLKVKQGKHAVLIRAKDAAGNVDATPAKVKFKRVPKPR